MSESSAPIVHHVHLAANEITGFAEGFYLAAEPSGITIYHVDIRHPNRVTRMIERAGDAGLVARKVNINETALPQALKDEANDPVVLAAARGKNTADLLYATLLSMLTAGKKEAGQVDGLVQLYDRDEHLESDNALQFVAQIPAVVTASQTPEEQKAAVVEQLAELAARYNAAFFGRRFAETAIAESKARFIEILTERVEPFFVELYPAQGVQSGAEPEAEAFVPGQGTVPVLPAH